MKSKATPHPGFKEFVGMNCKVHVGKGDPFHRKVTFVGTNPIGQKVVTFAAPSRGIQYLTSWNDLSIELDPGN